MLVFIIAIYKRHHLTRIALTYYRKLAKKYGFKIIVAGSEGNVSKNMARGCTYIEVDNFPITQKNNAMMQKAKEFNPDAVVLLGSDDFICENVIKHYYDLIKKKEESVCGFEDIYFYGVLEKHLSHFVSNKNFGAGRFFPKKVLETINYTGWRGEENRGLDGINLRLLHSKRINYKSIRLSEINGFMVDVKTDFNISNKNIIFVGKQINTDIMEQKGIPKTKIDEVVVKPKTKAIPIFDFQPDKTYEVEATGTSAFLPKGKKYKLDGLQAKLLAKKGAIIFKG